MKQLYRVSFFKRLTDSTGHPVDVPQGSVEVHGDRKSRAVRAARQRFAELKSVRTWTLRADYENVEIIANRKCPLNSQLPSKLRLGMGSLDDLFDMK
jgi:hypothetical protein